MGSRFNSLDKVMPACTFGTNVQSHKPLCDRGVVKALSNNTLPRGAPVGTAEPSRWGERGEYSRSETHTEIMESINQMCHLV
eukprot:12064972-Ditylum_brightwellii.AAC.1